MGRSIGLQGPQCKTRGLNVVLTKLATAVIALVLLPLAIVACSPATASLVNT